MDVDNAILSLFAFQLSEFIKITHRIFMLVLAGSNDLTIVSYDDLRSPARPDGALAMKGCSSSRDLLVGTCFISREIVFVAALKRASLFVTFL